MGPSGASMLPAPARSPQAGSRTAKAKVSLLRALRQLHGVVVKQGQADRLAQRLQEVGPDRAARVTWREASSARPVFHASCEASWVHSHATGHGQRALGRALPPCVVTRVPVCRMSVSSCVVRAGLGLTLAAPLQLEDVWQHTRREMEVRAAAMDDLFALEQQMEEVRGELREVRACHHISRGQCCGISNSTNICQACVRQCIHRGRMRTVLLAPKEPARVLPTWHARAVCYLSQALCVVHCAGAIR